MKSLYYLILSLVLVASFQGFQVSADSEPTLREVKSHLGDYFGAPDQKYANVVTKLRKADRKVLSKCIASYFRNEDDRPHALKMAIDLKIPGLLKSVKKHIDSDDEDQIVKLLFVAQDKTSIKFLYDRWMKSDVDSLAFSLVKDGFVSHHISFFDYLEKFKSVMTKKSEDEERKSSALDILVFQMGLDTKDPGEIKSNWKTLFENFQLFGKYFPIDGAGITQHEGWTATNATTVGGNYQLLAGSALQWTVPEDLRGNMTLTMQVMPFDISGTSRVELTYFGPNTKNQESHAFEYENGAWGAGIPGGKTENKTKDREWASIKFKLVHTPEAKNPDKYRLIAEINGENIFKKVAGTAKACGPIAVIKFVGHQDSKDGKGGLMVGGLQQVYD